MRYLSICAIAKNEDPYLLEWCAFHRVCGVQHIYIFDNESDTSIRTILAKYIDEGFVSVYDAPGRGIQMEVYANATKQFGKETHFMGFIDVDEYLVCKKSNDIKKVLQRFDQPGIGSFQVSWRLFGSNGHITKPEGLTIENFTAASPISWSENLHTKSICIPDRCLGTPAGDPHHMNIKRMFVSVSENMKPMRGPFAPEFCANEIQLNHYVVRSREEFENKIKKGRIDTEKWPGKTMEDFTRFDEPSTEIDN